MRSIVLFLLACSGAHAVFFPNAINDFVSASYAQDGPKLWVLIVAGSNGFYNYRHQADAYHAYQIMKRHGLPDSQIIVMHYDDIAHDAENPTPGIVINHPHGMDVYSGVPKDYTGNDVTPENFLSVLTGNVSAVKNIGSGKVIASGPNDHVFVNFVDHGAPGLVAFPNDELQATDFIAALKLMHKLKKYAKMLLYFEACESGSMFDGLLPADVNIFATTASNPDESSYACYYDDKRGTYLGDVYSVNWMEDSDEENLSKETLQEQFKLVKKETNTSHVMEYGNLTMGLLKISEFMGADTPEPIIVPKVSKADAVPQEAVYLTLLQKKAKKALLPDERNYWINQIDHTQKRRMFVMTVLRKIALSVARGTAHARQLLTTRRPLRGNPYACLAAANKFFSQHCFSLARNDYAMFTAPRFLANACMDGIDAGELIHTMESVCTHQPMTGIH